MRRFADTMAWVQEKGFAIDAAVDERRLFLRKTYGHLLAEICAAALVGYVVLHVGSLTRIAVYLWSNLFIYLAAFFGVSLISRKLMQGHKALSTQYAGAALWVVFLGILVSPLALIARHHLGSYAVLGEAFVLTACVFTGLTAYVFFTKKDFSFLGGALWMGSWLLVGVAVVSFLFGGFAASPWYSVAWVILLSGWVLYDTSQLLHRRHVGEYVAASVELLVDFVFLFIHIALLLIGSRD